ncbi:MAG: hypothetical protein LBG86_01795, partial [Puniceicoccales bacterium]|nr:hypothetical protein [Puniceicoccales bacterium]
MINSEQYVNEIPAEFADVPSHVLQMLMQLGFVACGKGYPSLAIDIFTGISAVRPHSELPRIGRAFAHVLRGQLSAA